MRHRVKSRKRKNIPKDPVLLKEKKPYLMTSLTLLTFRPLRPFPLELEPKGLRRYD